MAKVTYGTATRVYGMRRKSDDEVSNKLMDVLDRYAEGKQNLEAKIIENDRWYRSQHWDLMRRQQDNQDPEPTSGYLFSTLNNKHADVMDYYPLPNFTPREEDDEEEAETLSKIVPVILKQNKYRKTYSDSAMYLLKQGFKCEGVFWDQSLMDGMGDICIKRQDVLNMYWQPGITDIQESPYLFVSKLEENDQILKLYPQLDGKLGGDSAEVKEYVHDDTIDTTNKTIIWDCYEKEIKQGGKTVVHLTKIISDNVVSSTKTDKDLKDDGLYDHGKYPFVMSVLFPEENTPIGFGFVDIIKSPQMYIDKLDQLITKNALISGRVRYLVQKGVGIDSADLADHSKDVIETNGSVREGENFLVLQGKPMAAFVHNHRENKINELKDISSTQDFSRGDVGGGVTAASAIAMLQEAGNKTSRDMIGSLYESYSEMIEMVVELIRQFYDEERTFRITNEYGDSEYKRYTNKNMQEQQKYDDMGLVVTDEEGNLKLRKPIFDIEITPEKASPFSRAAQNELAKEMFSMGMFNPEVAASAKIALSMMNFEGKEKVLRQVAENGDLFQQLQQAQAQIQELGQVVQGMNEVIKKSTGRDMTQLDGQAVQA